MAPIFDANAGESGLRSLWSAGQDLVAAAAARTELTEAIRAMQDSLAELENSLQDAEYGYAEAHAHAMTAGWTPHELTDLGLPRPTADQRDASTLHHRPDLPEARGGAAARSAGRRRPTANQPESRRSASPTNQARAAENDDPLRRTSWEADQTSFLVASRSSDMPVWYESMRQSRISPSPKPFSAADLESSYWRGAPKPGNPEAPPAR